MALRASIDCDKKMDSPSVSIPRWLLLVLIAAIVLCSWLSLPGSSLNRSAWQAFDCAVATLSQGDNEDEEEEDDALLLLFFK